jgi:hypothetical protein
MMEAEQVGRFLLSQGGDGLPLRLSRHRKELVCVAVEVETARLVEIHFLLESEAQGGVSLDSVEQRMRQAMEREDFHHARFLEAGRHEGLCYYVEEFQDGEPILSLGMRCGGIDAAAAVALVYQLVEAIESLRLFPRLYRNLKLEWTMVVPVSETYMVPVLADYGFCEKETALDERDVTEKRLLELANMLFLLLKGVPFDGEEETLMQLTHVPSAILLLIKHILGETRQAPTTLEQFRNALEEGWKGLPGKRVGTHPRQWLPLEPSRAPRRAFAGLAFQEVSMPEESLAKRYQWDPASLVGDAIYQRQGFDEEKNRRLLLQRIPPERILPKHLFHPPHRVMSLIQRDSLTHLVRPCAVWETSEALFVLEEGGSHVNLARLMALRHHLLPEEAHLLLVPLLEALKEADQAGLAPPSLVPSQILLCFPEDRSGSMAVEAKVRHVDSWPNFVVKLRVHGAVGAMLGFPGQHRYLRPEPAAWRRRRSFANLLLLLITGLGQTPPKLTYEPLLGWLEDLRFTMEAPTGLMDEEEMVRRLGELLPPPASGGGGVIGDEELSRSRAMVSAEEEVIVLPPLNAD